MVYRNLAPSSLKSTPRPALMAITFGRWKSGQDMINDVLGQKETWLTDTCERILPAIDLSANAGMYDVVPLSWKDLGARNRVNEINRQEYPVIRGRQLGFEPCSAAMGVETLGHILMTKGWPWGKDISYFCMVMEGIKYNEGPEHYYESRLEIEYNDTSSDGIYKKLGECCAAGWDSVRWLYLRPKG